MLQIAALKEMRKEKERDLVIFKTEFHTQPRITAFDPNPSGVRLIFHFQYDSLCCMTL